MVKEIKVLGSGCPSCVRLEDNVKMALEKSGNNAKITKVTDISKIISYGVMSTPALVFDEKVVSFGKVNSVDEIVELLDEGCCSDKNSCDINCSPKNKNKCNCKDC